MRKWTQNVYKTCQKSSRAELRFEFRQAEPTSYSKYLLGTLLAIQWLKLHTASVGGKGSIPGLELRSPAEELRSRMWLSQKKEKKKRQLKYLLAVAVLGTQSGPALCDPRDCSSPGSSVYGVLQAKIREWVAIPFSSGSSRPRDWTQVSCIAGRFFTMWATREAPNIY